MSKTLPTKSIAKRLDLNYFKSPNGIVLAKRLLILVCGAAAGLWAALYSTSADDGIYNPGPVSSAHAHFEHDCRTCHTGVGGDGKSFDLAVHDLACLNCHDGAVHHGTQTRLISRDGRSAANCSSCHTEHRGHAALAATNNLHCVQCHADLPANSKAGGTSVPERVIGFSREDHPNFGRELRVDGGRWGDRTPLKFNHARHMGMAEIRNDCAACHAGSDVSPLADDLGTAPTPPWRTEKDRPVEWARVTDRSFIQPVNYEKHCMACHAIRLSPDGPVLAHEKMEVVRAQVEALPSLYARMIARDPKKTEKLSYKVGVGPRAKTVTLTEREWAEKRLADLKRLIEKGDPGQHKPQLDELLAVLDGDQKTASEKREAELKKAAGSDEARLAELRKLLGVISPEPAWSESDAQRAEFFLAYQAKDGCALCHEMRGSVPAVASTKKTGGELLSTVPTGIPTQPRRWFVHSRFDHDAHRDLDCTQCHGEALASTLTSDVLLPRIDACVRCHHAPDETGKGATVNCVSCHVFHDRTAERVAPAALKERQNRTFISPGAGGLPSAASPTTR